MQRPVRAIVYGFAAWWLWFGFIGIARFFPASITEAPSFASVRLLVLVLLVVFLAVDYLRRIEQDSTVEGLAVGVTWAVLMVANDIGHFVFMGPASIGPYLSTFAPLYIWIPVVTTLLFWRLRARIGLASRPTD